MTKHCILPCNQLAKAIQLASAAIEKPKKTGRRGRNGTIPILQMMRLRVSRKKATVEATNLDQWIEVDIDGSVEGKIDTLINPKCVGEIARQGFDEVIRIEDTPGGTQKFQSGELEMTWRRLCEPEDWPSAAKANLSTSFSMSAKELRETFAVLRPAISTEATRYYLNGVFLHESRMAHEGFGGTAMVATQGRILTLRAFDVDAKTGDVPDVIIPRDAVDLLLRGLRRGSNQAVQFGIHGDTVLKVEASGFTLTTKLIDGRYPAYERVIPAASEEPATRLTISHEQVRRLCSISAASSPNKFSMLRIEPEKNVCLIELVGDSTGHITVPLHGTARGETFGVSLELLNSLLTVSGDAGMESAGPGDPIRLTFEHPRTLSVLMPMRV